MGEADLGQRLARGSHMELCRLSIFRFVPVIRRVKGGEKMSLSILIAVICALLNWSKIWWHFVGSEIFGSWQSCRRVSRPELRNEDNICCRVRVIFIPLASSCLLTHTLEN